MNFRKALSIFTLLAGLAGAAFGQVSLTQTTLAAPVSGPALYSGTSPTISSTVTLAACSGIAAPLLPGTPTSIIYVGREAMGVFSMNSATCVATVNRGYLGTQASPHPSGDMVLYGLNYSTTIAQGGNPVPNGFFQQDPPANGTCTPTATPSTPWVNVLTGAQWLCSTISSTWVPGFVNPLTTIVDVPNTAVASATTILPSGPFFHLTGTTTVQTITTPVGCDATAVGGCQFTLICDAVCVWNASGNISAASGTVVAHTSVTFNWDAVNSKWVPSTTT